MNKLSLKSVIGAKISETVINFSLTDPNKPNATSNSFSGCDVSTVALMIAI